jgi:hypothetical protein
VSANPVIPLKPGTEGYQETLAERMARGRMPLAEALGYATQIAACLRDMHMQRLVYGAVSSQLILLGTGGAKLRNSGRVARLGNVQGEVAAFGAVLSEIVHKTDGAEDLCSEAKSLAVSCQDDAPDMQQVLIRLRIMGLKARHAAAPVRRPVLAPRAVRAPRAQKVRLRLHLSLHWRPLVNLVAGWAVHHGDSRVPADR